MKLLQATTPGLAVHFSTPILHTPIPAQDAGHEVLEDLVVQLLQTTAVGLAIQSLTPPHHTFHTPTPAQDAGHEVLAD
eukprot:365473-Chlamydomonas_euryale.AAC.3